MTDTHHESGTEEADLADLREALDDVEAGSEELLNQIRDGCGIQSESLETLVEEWRMAAKDERAEMDGGDVFEICANELETLISQEVSADD